VQVISPKAAVWEFEPACGRIDFQHRAASYYDKVALHYLSNLLFLLSSGPLVKIAVNWERVAGVLGSKPGATGPALQARLGFRNGKWRTGGRPSPPLPPPHPQSEANHLLRTEPPPPTQGVTLVKGGIAHIRMK